MAAELRDGRNWVIDQVLVRQLLRVQKIDYPRSLVVYGLPMIRRAPGSSITFGERVVLNSRRNLNELSVIQPVSIRTVTESAAIELGDDTGMSGAVICAASSIVIGKRVLIGTNTMITDSDHHAVRIQPVSERRYSARRFDAARPVRIEDDVFIGANCIILKGSFLGRGAVLGAGSVLAGRIPPYTIAAGNPAVPISTLDHD